MIKKFSIVMALFLPIPATASAHYYGGCQKRPCKRHVVKPYSKYFNGVARCESGGRWHINTGNGFYGGLQFTLSSWRAVGGVGYPHHHPKYEQKYRGTKLLMLQGPGAWPHCG